MLTELQDLEETAAKLLKAARKLAPGWERHGILMEIGIFGVRRAEDAGKRRDSCPITSTPATSSPTAP